MDLPEPFNLAIAARCKCDNRAVELILHARCEYADHALMPAGIKQAQAVGIRILSCRHECCDWCVERAVSSMQCAILHVRFDFPALAIKRVELQGNLRGADFVIGDEAFDSQRHIVEPARRIQSRPEHETQFISRYSPKIPPRNLQQSVDARTATSLADALQALVHQNAIVVIEFHDIGNGAQCDQIKQTGKIGFFLRGGKYSLSRATRPVSASIR